VKEREKRASDAAKELQLAAENAQRKVKEMDSEAYRFALGRAHEFLAKGKASEALKELEPLNPRLRGWEYGHLLRAAAAKAAPCIWTVGDHGRVNAVLFTPDGRTVISAAQNGKISVRVTDGANVLKEMTYPGKIRAAAISPDGKRLFAGGSDKTVHVYDVGEGKELSVLSGLGDGIESLAVSPKGDLVAAGGVSCAVAVWNTEGQVVHRITWDPEIEGGDTRVYSVAFSPSGGTMAFSQGSTVSLYDTRTWTCRRKTKEHKNRVNGIAFTPDGKLMATGSDDTTIMLWEAGGASPVGKLEGHTGGVLHIAISQDGKRLMSCGYDTTLIVWDLASRTAVSTIKGHKTVIQSLDVSSDGTRIVSGDLDGDVRLWRVPMGSATTILEGHENEVYSLKFDTRGEHLLSVGLGHSGIIVWRVADGRRVSAESPEHVSGFALAFSPLGNAFAVSTISSQEVWFYGWPDCKLVAKCPVDAKQLERMVWSADGKRVAVVDLDGNVFVLEASSQKLLHKMQNPTRGLFGRLAIAPDGKTIAVGAGNCSQVVFWNLETGAKIRSLPAPKTISALAFSPDGRWLAAGCGHADGRILLWNLAEEGPPRVLEGHENYVLGLCFHPDSKRLASSGEDKTVRIWDVIEGREIVALREHAGGVTDVAFSPDGRNMATASRDKRVVIWHSEPWTAEKRPVDPQRPTQTNNEEF
jgi:WD40 repeat protein